MPSSSFFDDLKLRRNKFWQQCIECAAHHNERRGVVWEWPQDGVEDFFSHWSAMNRQGQMRWETIPFWSIGERMGSFMKRRRYLNAYYDAKLENARNPRGRSKSLEQVRAEAQDAEAQSAYDKLYEELEAAQKKQNGSRKNQNEENNKDN